MIITQTPLRISFLGGNTDFVKYYQKHGGAFLTTAIDKYIYCIVKERFDNEIRVTYSIKETVNEVKDLKHDLVREAMKLVGVTQGVEIMFLSDIPSEGSGLGSSSSVLVGVLNALHHFVGETVSAEQLAKEACHIEINLLKRPIGVQDQYIAAYGGLRFFEADSTGLISSHMKISNEIKTDFIRSVMLFYTGKTRSTQNILTNMKLNKRILDRNKLLAYQGKKTLEKGNIIKFGKLLDKYWQLKKKLNSKTSNCDIDTMYEKAKTAGAIGGKIAGAGGGGFLLLIVPPNSQDRVRKALVTKELSFGIGVDGSKVIFNIRR